MKEAVFAETEKGLSVEEALRYLIDGEFSTRQYKLTRKASPDTFPPYHQVARAKEEAYPDVIIVSNDASEVPLKELMEHTSLRILKTIAGNIDGNKLTLISKWGCDGSTATNYKQIGFAEEAKLQATQHIYQTCLVPLKLVNESDEGLWINSTPSSPRLCRPIRLIMITLPSMKKNRWKNP